MSVNGSSASGTINGTYNRDSFKRNWPGSGNPGCYALGYLHPGYLVREILLHQGPFVFKTLAHIGGLPGVVRTHDRLYTASHLLTRARRM
jgi:hypothetical protein